MKVLVVGCGSIGKRHIRNFMAKGATEILGVDPREDRRQEVTNLYGVQKTFADIESALKDGGLEPGKDAAVVASPTSMHIDQCIDLANARLHLLIEKPLAHNLDGFDKLLTLTKEHRLATLMAYPFRFDPSVQKFKELVDKQAAGRQLFVRGDFSEYLPDWHPWEDYRTFYMAKKSQGGGSILDQSHIVDMVHWIFGDVDKVYAVNGRFSSLEVETDDLAEMIYKMKSGVIANVHTDMFGRDHKKHLELLGEKGNITWDWYTRTVEVYYGEEKRREVFSFKHDPNTMYLSETEHFMNCVSGKEKPLADAEVGAETMKILLGALDSASTGKEVSI